MKIKATNSDLLYKYNALSRMYAEAVKDLGDALNSSVSKKTIDVLRKKADALRSDLSSIEKRLPRLKFDFSLGEYFEAKNGDREEFRFRITETRSSVVKVMATSRKEAESILDNIVADSLISRESKSYKSSSVIECVCT